MKISKKVVFNSIKFFQDEFSIQNQMHLAAFFILKYVGISFSSLTFDDVNKDDFDVAIRQLGAMFDENTEEATKSGFLFPFNLKALNYYNQKTSSSKVFSRFKDTVDNSLVDPKHFLSLKSFSSEKKEYTLRSNYIEIVKGYLSGKKIPITPFIVWLYRFLEIEKDSYESEKELKTILISKFQIEYKITDIEFKELFTYDSMNISLTESGISAIELRKLLNVETEIKTIEKKVTKQFSVLKWREKLNNKNITIGNLERIVKTYQNVILYGPPGTSKSWIVDQLSKNFDCYEVIQFHPTYSYEDFIYSLKLENQSFVFHEGDLLRVSKEASANPQKNFLLLIDEINRANLSEVLGQAIICLDRRNDITINTQVNSFKLSIPKNLFIIGTMNSSDKSISIVDLAIRRRFAFIRFYPNEDLVNELSDYTEIDGFNIANLMKSLNDRLYEVHNNNDFLLGHSFFIPRALINNDKISWTKNAVVDLMNYQIIPMLEEILSGEHQVVQIVGQSFYEHRFSTVEQSWNELRNSLQ